MNRIKSAIILAIALTAIAAMAAAQNIVQNSVHNMSVSAHANTKTDIKLAPRSPLVPYHSREAALEGDPNASQWSIGLADWKREAAAEYTRYSARVKIPRTWDGRAVILRTEGVTASFEVAMNGKAAGYSNSGMAYAEFDLTEYAHQDYNDISVTIYGVAAALEVENHRSHDNPVIGSAALISQPLVRIRDFAVETSVERGTGWLSLAIMTQSHLRNPKDCVVSYELISPEGKVVAQSSRELTTKWMSADTLRFAVSVPDVKRWNHETPHIYTIVAKIFREGRFTEYIPAKIGFRSVSHSNGCLLIDGVKVPVYNIVFGWQGDYASTEAGLHSLKWRGFNCVTVPGYPQPDGFYRACDEVGIYVCNVADVNTGKGPEEITRGGNRSNDPAWLDVFISRAMEMLCTSHLHPSVVMLSPATGSPDGYCLYESYLALKKEGMGRPVVYPEAGDQWNNDHVSMLSPDGRKPQASIDGSRLAGDKVVYIDNNMVLTPLKGTLIYRIMQGNSVKYTVSTTVDIHAGGRFELSIPAEASAKAKKNRSLDVSVSVNCADYCLPANFPTSEGNSKKTNNSPEAVIAFEKFVF